MPAVPSDPPAQPVFDLDAGWLALDFVNTLSASSGEHLTAYADLVAFVQQAGLLTPTDAEWLRAEAQRDPEAASGVLRRARRLRAALQSLFSALAAGKRPRPSDLARLNIDLAVSLPHARVEARRDQHGFVWTWVGRNFDAPLWPITRSAADLLVSDADRGKIRECGAPGCTWLFLDTSKNRSRQWCSMASCGNRQKARRHYQRLKQQHQASPAGAAAGGGAPRRRGRAPRSAATPAVDASATAE